MTISGCSSSNPQPSLSPTSTTDPLAALQSGVVDFVNANLQEAIKNQPTLTQNLGEEEFKACVTSFSLNNARSVFESKLTAAKQGNYADSTTFVNESIGVMQTQFQQTLQICSQG